MSKIKIENFGPIKEGYQQEDGFINIKKFTVFIGSQGSGKSTVAKLISTLSWIEKALVRGDFKANTLTGDKFKKHCAYQNIRNYFKENTLIDYFGKAYQISYINSQIIATKNDNNNFDYPKIMYIPAERNFVSGVKNINKLKGLPQTLYTFTEEDKNAKEDLNSVLLLPINNATYEYRKPSNASWIIGNGFEIKLSESSSGFQSSVPLYLVSRYLALSINKEKDSTIKEISIEEKERIQKEIKKISSNQNISDDVKQLYLEQLSAKLKYSCFINIVEEPEQNLFPKSQKSILYSLLEFNNMNIGNKLIMTTHSPYLINIISIAIQGHYLLDKINTAKREDLKERLVKIVPENSCIPESEVVIYEFDEENGTIIKLNTFEGIPSDKNYLNQYLREGNILFDSLLEIEQEL